MPSCSKISRGGWHDCDYRELAAPAALPYTRGPAPGERGTVGGNREMLQRYGLAVLSHLLLVAAWHFFVVLGNVPKFVMPSPYDTVRALLVPNLSRVENISVTGCGNFGGYFIAVIAGDRHRAAFFMVSDAGVCWRCRCSSASTSFRRCARAADHRLVQLRIKPNMMMAFAIWLLSRSC